MTGVWEPLNQSGLWLHIAVPRSEVVRSLPAIQWVALVLACLYLLLIPALLLILNRRLLRPLLDIRRAMLKLGRRRPGLPPPRTGTAPRPGV